MDESYPLTYSVDYPDRDLDRVTSFFRIFTVIPIAIVLGTVSHVAYGGWDDSGRRTSPRAAFSFGGPLLMILFRKKYPRWWFDWNRELLRFTQRVAAYFALMSDVYPSTDEQQYVHLEIDYPNAETDLSRGMPLVKWFLAIPHYFVLIFLYIARVLRGDLRLVRDPVHRPLSAVGIRLRDRSGSLGASRDRLRVHPGD